MRVFSFLLVCVFSISEAYAQSLTVIYDSGNTLSLSSYYKESNLAPIKSRKDFKALIAQKHDKQTFQLNFPIVSKKVSPGIVKNRKIKISHVQTPIFIVGADRQSRQWLSIHYDELVHLKAIGLLTNIDNAQVLASMEALVPKLKLLPVVVDDIVEQLKLQHYPVLISKTAIEQ